ncbi:hypothetical protein [Actinoplanes sp. RD1]|uniref:hypothetical protein n=1 Tax=Actinoplanes sp. RD1 TaxID=3064538 RepID=UPI0027411C23|nr:hypothetical protein [Actinoplanes sp. RD1]
MTEPTHSSAADRVRIEVAPRNDYPVRVADEGLAIMLTKDQAPVLSDWLYRVIGTPAFDTL